MSRTSLVRARWFTLWVVGLALGASAEPARRQRELMHTVVSVVIADPLEEPALTSAFEDVFAVFADIEKTMNEWEPESALGRINSSAGGKAVASPAPLCDVIRLSLDGAKRTGGLFDPSWAALRSIWRFGDNDPPRVPPAEEVKKGCALVGYRDVEVTPADPTHDGGCQVRLRRAGMKLGLGGVVKGWGVDQAVARLRARKLKNFFIQAGGDLYLAGKNGDRAWRAGIRDPRGPPDQIFAKMEVEDRAFSTSGDYEHFFIVDNVRYHHIIDPRTCVPATGSRSVTVLAKTATDAEFLTKSAFILGGDKGVALAEKFGAAAVIVDADNKLHVSKSLEGRIELLKPTP
jgi:thiamine biosynthesis lipoprotein